jgi:poly-D-alanine transfer protein DltD
MYNNIMSQNIVDNWEGLKELKELEELEELEDSNKPLTTQQQKMIEERKRMEASDNELIESLFSETQTIKQENKIEPALKKVFKKPERNKGSFHKTQKDLSVKINNRIHTQNEVFGECDDPNFVKYCDLEEKYLD